MKLSTKEPTIKVRDENGIRNAIIGDEVKLKDGSTYVVGDGFSLHRAFRKRSGKERRAIRRQIRQESYQ